MSVIHRNGLSTDDRHVLEPAEPYSVVLVASPESTARKNLFERLPDVLVLDPLRVSDAALIGPLQPPTTGCHGLPRWAVYDCAEVPGAIVGLLHRPIEPSRTQLPPPLAFILAIPHAETNAWHFSNLTVPPKTEETIQLRMIEIAIKVLGADRVTMTLPWTSRLLGRLAGRGRTEILAARSLLHGPEPTATVQLDALPTTHAHRTSSVFEVPTEAKKLSAMADRIQAALENGRRYLLAPPPKTSQSHPMRLMLCETAL